MRAFHKRGRKKKENALMDSPNWTDRTVILRLGQSFLTFKEFRYCIIK